MLHNTLKIYLWFHQLIWLHEICRLINWLIQWFVSDNSNMIYQKCLNELTYKVFYDVQQFIIFEFDVYKSNEDGTGIDCDWSCNFSQFFCKWVENWQQWSHLTNIFHLGKLFFFLFVFAFFFYLQNFARHCKNGTKSDSASRRIDSVNSTPLISAPEPSLIQQPHRSTEKKQKKNNKIK